MATINAASASRADVVTAIGNASSGDTVVVPSGTQTWASAITVNKGLIIQGAGRGSTVITGNGFNYTPTSGEATNTFELSGFSFDGDGADTTLFEAHAPSSSVAVTGLKIHDCDFDNVSAGSQTTGQAILLWGLEFGVFYNCYFTNNKRPIFIWNCEQAGFDYWDNNGNTQGGSAYPFFEDCTFDATAAHDGFEVFETGRGGRIVLRHCDVSNTGGAGWRECMDMHGINGDWYDGGRGTVSAEIYNNTFTMPAVSGRWLNHRGGRAIVANNTINRAFSLEMTEYYAWSYSNPPPWWASGPWAPYVVNNSYYWANTYDPEVAQTESEAYIREGQEYWPDIGALATGKSCTSGLESARPATCATGDVYCSTDSMKIWKATGTNTWGSPIYTAYTYPHPLRGELLAAPANVRWRPA